MIDRALNTLGRKKCPKCSSVMKKERNACEKCGHSFVKTSTPEDGL